MSIEHLTNTCGEWLKGSGPDSDIVMSSRIRLARNLADFPFVRRCTDIDRANIESTVRERLKNSEHLKSLNYINVATLDTLDQQFLVERQLISRELAQGNGARAVAIDEQESLSLMVNEEDHLRIQLMRSGFDIDAAWQMIDQVDDEIEEHITYAFNSKLGYLTACPTNVGTGMRVSVLMHLPALVDTRQIEKVFRALQKINLAVRGLHGEGSQAMGDFYQISNQITLGKSEHELMRQVCDAVPAVISYERKAREFLISQSQHDLFDQVSRAYGTLQTAQKISSEETMHLLSKVRMGVNLGLIGDVEIKTLNKLFICTQPAHLQKMVGSKLDTAHRNRERANYLHAHLKSLKNGDKTDGVN
ncbi:MAG TPA: protein arginine kinase [Pirellulaceae bacterium]|nr:protein arginine kinase [Pirellulaceae bacterium]HMO92913.1 protein arginine kinase [Pirellulaceae bacterium]HMP69191.1 protein arginine kinase [Pirellulaceae bacterium]